MEHSFVKHWIALTVPKPSRPRVAQVLPCIPGNMQSNLRQFTHNPVHLICADAAKLASRTEEEGEGEAELPASMKPAMV